MNVADEQLKQALQNYDQAFGEYKVGKGDILSVVFAETLLAQAREQDVVAKLNLYLAKALLERVSGIDRLESLQADAQQPNEAQVPLGPEKTLEGRMPLPMNLTTIKALPTKKKIILLAVIAVVLLLAAVVVWRVFLVKPATQVLDTGTVEKGSIRGVLVETGIIKSQVGAVVKIGAQTTGRIQKMKVKVGDRVKAGELIALVDDREIREQIGQQQAALLSARNTLTQVEQTYPERIREARANHDYAKVNVERERELLKHEYTTKDSVDKAESQFTATEAVLKRLQDEYRTQLTISKSSVEEIQARLRQQEVRMTYTKIFSPIDGIVSDVTAQEGETIVAGLQVANLVTVLDPTRLEMWIYVDETDIGKAAVGQDVEYYVDTFPAKTFKGKVEKIYPQPVVKENIVYYLSTHEGLPGRRRLPQAGDDHPRADHHGGEGEHPHGAQRRHQVRAGKTGRLPGHGKEQGREARDQDRDPRRGQDGDPLRGKRRRRARDEDRPAGDDRPAGPAEGGFQVMASPVCIMENITKSFHVGDQDLQVLKGINLTIEQGEFTAIMGTSGSGKSTLMNLMGCLDVPTSGRFILAGRDVTQLNDDELSELRNEHIGFVFQSFYLLPYATVLENVLVPTLYREKKKDHVRDRAAELLKLVGLEERMKFRPTQLSGGEQQRVAICRALINDPELLLADEPTGQLDSRTAEEIMNVLTRTNERGKTVVVITHDADIAAYARRIIHIRDGIISE